MSAEITFAEHIPTSKIVHIDKVLNGDACNCICRECNELLSAIQGSINEHHFRHQVVKDCKANFETALHLAVKEIILNAQEICLPGKGNVPYKNPKEEIILKVFRPDIVITDLTDKDIYIEITVTSGISDLKNNTFITSNRSLVEIDLTEVDRKIDYEQLKELILYTDKYKTIVCWEKERKDIENTVSNDLLKIGLVVSFVVALKWLINKFRST
jgi:hypothetical protein